MKNIIFLVLLFPVFCCAQQEITFYKQPVIQPKNGGIGLTSYKVGDLVYASGAEDFSVLHAGVSNQLLRTGSSLIPEYFTHTFPTISGGTTGYIPKLASATAFVNSKLYDNGTQVAFGTTTPTAQTAFSINGDYTTYPNGLLEIRNPAANVAFISITDNASGAGSANGILFGYNSGGFIINKEATPFTFSTSDLQRWQISASGHLLGVTDNTYDIGASGATRPRTGYFGTSVLAPIFNAATGFQIAGAATSGNYLRGNGTNFVSSAIQAGDIPDLAATYWKLGGQNVSAETSIGSNDAFGVNFKTNNVNRLRLDSGGRLFGGTLTDFIFTPSDSARLWSGSNGGWDITTGFSRLYLNGAIALQGNHSTGVWLMNVPDNTSSAYSMSIPGGGTFMQINTTNNSESILLGTASTGATVKRQGINADLPNATVTAADTMDISNSFVPVNLTTSGTVTIPAGLPDNSELVFLNLDSVASGVSVTIAVTSTDTWASGVDPVLTGLQSVRVKKLGTTYYQIE